MIRKIATIAAIVAGAALTYTVSANAMDFPATPMNAGPPVALPAEGIIPGMRETRMLVNGVTQPIFQPILAPGGGMAPEGGMAPMHRHHRHHHMMMMKKKMMMKHKKMM